MKKHIPYGRQFVDEDDIKAVVEVLRSDILTQGTNTAEFETELSKIVGSGYVTAVNSGTSALHSACLAAGVQAGDEVITSPITFVASANCAVYCGGRPVFADIDPKTYNIAPAEIEKRMTAHTKAIIPVHFAGQSCDMEAIRKIVDSAEKKYGHKIFIIEDACHALGSRYKDSLVGSCKFSDMAVMSFHPVKHITTGEGGAVFTNDPKLDIQLKRLRSHGITSDPDEFFSKDLAFSDPAAPSNKPNPWYYEQQGLGYNYRITNIQCALGLSQLKKLEGFCIRRREIVDTYNAAFADQKFLQTPFEAPACDSNFHLYVVLIDFENIRIDRRRMILDLRQKGFNTQVHYIPVHLQYFYRSHYGTDWGDCPHAEAYYQKCLSIPLFPALHNSDAERVVDAIQTLINA